MEKKTKKKELLSWFQAFIIAIILVWSVQRFIIVPVEVDGESMNPTLNDQDHLIIEKIPYRFFDPDRFDVIVFEVSEKRDYIKRIIGLPGETVEYKDNQLFIDGDPIEEPYLTEAFYTGDFTLEDDIPGRHELIPEGSYLVLGDHRQHSEDSRMIGLIKEDDIIGKAKFIYWPFSRIGLVN